MNKEAGAQKHINVIDKASRLIACFNAMHTELSLVELSELCPDIPKTTILGILRSLEDNCFLDKVGNSKNYRLGMRFLEINYFMNASLPIIQYVTPFLEDLQLSTGQNVYLTTHNNGRLLYLSSSLRYKNKIKYSVAGKTLPLYSTGAGKAILSHMSKDQVRESLLISGLEKRTEHTIVDLELLWNELQTTKKRGYAIDNEEESIGIRCVGVAITNPNGQPVGALSVSGDTLSMTEEKCRECVGQLLKAKEAISSQYALFPVKFIEG